MVAYLCILQIFGRFYKSAIHYCVCFLIDVSFQNIIVILAITKLSVNIFNGCSNVSGGGDKGGMNGKSSGIHASCGNKVTPSPTRCSNTSDERLLIGAYTYLSIL